MAALVLGLLAQAATAQLSPGGFSTASFQFNLSNPGARSLALGGAFAGLADDATAAYANPAGLTILTRPEVSAEARESSFPVPILSTEPTFEIRSAEGELIAVESRIAGLRLGEPDAGQSSLSFTSLVYPGRLRGRPWTLALYRHQLADLAGAAGTSIERPDLEIETVTTSFAIDIVGYGLAWAFRPTRQLSLGAGLVSYEASIRADRVSETCQAVVEGLECLSLGSRDADLAVNLGVLVRPAERWAVGLVYREGAEFALTQTGRTPEPRGPVELAPFRTPDVLAVGVSFQTHHVLLSFEWDRIDYSVLAREIPSVFEFPLPPEFGTLTDLGTLAVSDAEELRLGFEYAFWEQALRPALRLGAWYDPEHQVRFLASVPCPGVAETTADGVRCVGDPATVFANLPEFVQSTLGGALALNFPEGRDRVHVSGGVGVVVGSRFQLDAAFDWVDSDEVTVSLSGVVRF